MTDSAANPIGRPARLRFGAGPRATERLLLDELAAQLDRLGRRALEGPVRVIVPSASLRAHLLARLVERRGRAIAGVHCTTLFGLAIGIVERADGPPNLHDQLSLLLARRYAQGEPSLQRALAHLRHGFRAVDASVRDLREAGIDPAHVDALEEALQVDGPRSEASQPEIERAQALVRVAGRTLRALERLGVFTTSTLLRRAAELVRGQPAAALPTGWLAVYGFSDAIGVATDLLTALLDRHGGSIFIDRVPDPAEPGEPDAGNAFARRFTERVADVARPDDGVAVSEPVRISIFQAVGGDAEAREVAARLRALIDQGRPPERLAIVARRLEAHRTSLRTHLHRLAVPFSAAGAAGPRGPDGRRVQALLDLLEHRGSAPVERWLDARAEPFARIHDFDLQLALSAAGAGRLQEVPGRPLGAVARNGRYALPVRRGFTSGDEEVYARRRSVPLSALEAAVAAAGRLCARFQSWRDEVGLGRHAQRFRELLHEDLSWSAAGDLSRRVTALLDELVRGVPDDLEVTFDEFADLIRAPLERVGETPLGGRGAGVRILDVIEARGLTFEHLFVIGLNRGVFPKLVNEDPLLPDALRAVLSRHGFGVLQDLPQKLTGYDEERYLFSQLLSAAPEVTLSWQDVDEDNHQQTASPLIERLRWAPIESAAAWREPPTARHLYSAATAQLDEPGWRHRPAHEAAVLAGIHGDRAHFGKVLAVALDPAGAGATYAPRGLHAARLRILDEIDPERGRVRGERTRARLGPYYGFIGPIAAAGDPRSRERLFVTTLESLASCSWRAFLERLLRLQPIPDPLEALPAVEPLFIGNLVHRVLERIVQGQLERPSDSLAAARQGGSPVRWPAKRELAALLEREAHDLVLQEGFAFPGFARLMAEVVGPYLEIAREVDWSSGSALSSAATELYGSVEVEGPATGARAIWFKADRVDAGPELTLTDYKTGKPISDKKTEATRRKKLLANVRAGQSLQAVAYALAGGEPADAGRYVYLRPDAETELEHRTARVGADDTELADAFRGAIAATLAAWDRGAFLPRLIEPSGEKEFRFCASCRVAEACLRGDSGARGRLRDWVASRSAAAGAADPTLDPQAEAVLAVWKLRDVSTDDEPRFSR